MPTCPECGKPAKPTEGLARHLSGTYRYGGHEMDIDDARRLATSLASAEARSPGSSILKVQSDGPGPALTEVLQVSPDAESSFLLRLLRQMAADKELPKYQFERRIDAFLAVLLPDLLSQLLDGRVTYVVSEFPIKSATTNASTNVDHLYFDEARRRWLFLEIKTDAGSARTEQVSKYVAAVRRGMPSLVADAHDIRNASSSPGKYAVLLRRVAAYPLDCPIDVLYLAPRGAPRFSGCQHVSYADLAALEHREWPEVWEAMRTLVVPSLV